MITITKDKIYRSAFSLKRTKPDSEAVKEIDINDLVFSMGEDIELGEDVTFQRIFEIIIFHKDFFNVLFSSEMNGLQVEDFISDYEQEFDLVIPNQEYNLIMSWSCVVYEIDFEIEFYDYPQFEALGKIDTRVDEEDYPISLAFTSLSEIKNKIITLDNTFEIQNNKSYENEIEAAFKANYRPFRVCDVISGILHEISNYGTPDDREKAKMEMEIKSREIEEWIEDGTIMDHLISDDVMGEIGEMIDEEYDDSDDKTFWDVLYPSDKPKGKTTKDIMDSAIIAISEGSDLPLEDQLKEAHDAEDYEKAAKIKKLIEKRDERKK